MNSIDKLPPIDSDSGDLNIVIETPHGSRNKFKWDMARGIFLLDRVLPDGMAFPFDFGFIPGTLADDGDPLDAVVLVDVPASMGVLVPARPIGIIEAEQRPVVVEIRNDRLVAVAVVRAEHVPYTFPTVKPDLVRSSFASSRRSTVSPWYKRVLTVLSGHPTRSAIS